MDKVYTILAINPGSTSTKIALFKNNERILKKTIVHNPEKMKSFKEVQDQLPYRQKMIQNAVKEAGWRMEDIDVFVGRGGGTYPIAGGTYLVTDLWVEHASKGLPGNHPAQLASQICYIFKNEFGGEAYVVNPPDVDEFDDIARITGLAGVYRECHSHALNQKEIAIRYCDKHKCHYTESNLIICHMGGGISVTSHHNGRMIESSDIIGGEGPMTPTRVGALPTVKLIKICYSGKYTEKELINLLVKQGGLLNHFGTDNVQVLEERIKAGDEYAKLVFDAMIYQIGKNIGSCACAMKGKVDAIIFTGGMAYSEYLVKTLKEYAGWIAPVEVMPGEFEMEALASGAMRVLKGQEKALIYNGKPVWNGLAVGPTTSEC